MIIGAQRSGTSLLSRILNQHPTIAVPGESFFFNTFGNIALNPRVGLLFIDYVGNRLLQLAGRAEILIDDPAVAAYAGAERLLSITVERIVLRNNALPLAWSEVEISPFLAHTGQW